jgi:hypothetical protein
LTVTGNVHVCDCPSDELADPVTVVVPTGSLLPDTGFVETVTGCTPPVVVGSGHVTTAPSEDSAVTGSTVEHVMVSGGGGGGGATTEIAEDACSFLTLATIVALPSAIARTSPVVLTVAMAALDDHFTPVLFACSWTVCPFCRVADDGVTVNFGVTANVCAEVAAARPNKTQHTRMILVNLTLPIFNSESFGRLLKQ